MLITSQSHFTLFSRWIKSLIKCPQRMLWQIQNENPSSTIEIHSTSATNSCLANMTNEDVALLLAEAVSVDAFGKHFARLHVRLQLICKAVTSL